MVTGRRGVKIMVEVKRMSENVNHVAGTSDIPRSMPKPLCLWSPLQCLAGTISVSGQTSAQ